MLFRSPAPPPHLPPHTHVCRACLQVQMPCGRVAECLLPLVSLLNHSPWPHTVHYSKLDPATQQIRSGGRGQGLGWRSEGRGQGLGWTLAAHSRGRGRPVGGAGFRLEGVQGH